MRNKIFVSLFFVLLSPVLIIGELFLLKNSDIFVSYNKIISPAVTLDFYPYQPGKQVLSSGAQRDAQMTANILGADARPILIRDYLLRYDSPLVEFSDVLFDVAQKYGVDYRLMVAIAQQESNLCKRAPPNCYNCWGVGIHSRGTMCFDSYPQAIEWLGNYLRNEYLDKGLQTPEEIMSKYCPLSSGSWAFGIRQFMAQME